MSSTSPFQADARARLNAFFAGINELSPEARAPAVREYLERGLARLQALEHQHFAFLGECAMLAADNVQDMRLYELERRVRLLENPESDWGEVLLGVVLNVAVQIAVLVAWEAAVGALISLVGSSVVSRALTQSAASYDPANIEQALRNSYKQSVATRNRAHSVNFLLDRIAEDAARNTLPAEGVVVDLGNGLAPMTVKTSRDWLIAKTTAATLLSVRNAEMQVSRRAVAESKKTAQQAFENALADAQAAGDRAIKAWSADWRDFVGGERGNLVLSPAYSVFDKLRSDIYTAEVPTPQTWLPITSEVAGRFLDWTSQRAFEVADEYESWRLHVRYSTDTDLKKDTRCAALAQLVTESLPQLEVQRTLVRASRSLVVAGFETAYLLDVLRGNGYLTILPDQTFFVAPGDATGDFVAGHVLKSLSSDALPNAMAWGRLWRTDYYVGVALMSEGQATYMYHRYAKAWYAVQSNRNAAKLPFPYDAANYARLVSDQTEVWEGQLTNREHEKRVDEMKLLVILYFIALMKGEINTELQNALGEDQAAELHNFLADAPAGGVPDAADGAAAALNALQAVKDPLRALYSAVGGDSQTQFKLAALQFADALAVAERTVENYLALTSEAALVLAIDAEQDPQQLESDIVEQREQLDAAYDSLLAMSQDDPEATDWLQETIGERLQALREWHPPMIFSTDR